MILAITILLILLLLPFPWFYGYLEGAGDAVKIEQDGSRDSLKERFHGVNLAERLSVMLFVSGLLVWPLNQGLILAGAYFVYGWAAFGYTFTQVLNRKRGLPNWYVSPDRKAAKTDKVIRRLAWELSIDPFAFSRLLHTVFLIAGIAVLVVVTVQKMLINN